MKRGLFALFLILISIIIAINVSAEETVTGIFLTPGDNVTVGGRDIKFLAYNDNSAIFKIDGYSTRVLTTAIKDFHGVKISLIEFYGGIVQIDVTAYYICGDNTCSDNEFCCKDCGCIVGYECNIENICMQGNQSYFNDGNSSSNFKLVNSTNSTILTTNESSNQANTSNVTDVSKPAKKAFPLNLNFSLDFLSDPVNQYILIILVLVIVLVYIRFELARRKTAHDIVLHRKGIIADASQNATEATSNPVTETNSTQITEPKEKSSPVIEVSKPKTKENSKNNKKK